MNKHLLSILLTAASGLLIILLALNLSVNNEQSTSGPESPLSRLEWEHRRLADPATGKIPPLALWNAYLQLVADGKMKPGPFLSQANARDGEWQQVNDFFASLAITKITHDPNNTQIFYFCTGEGWYNADYSVGAGVFKSDDGGNSWNQLSATATSAFSLCQDIDIHPATSDVYVATQTSGLMRSQDGGNSWNRVLSVPGSLNNSVCDVEFTKNGGIFATTGIFQSGGVWYSETGDSGTWVKQTSFPAAGSFRVELATAPSNDSVAYAVTCKSATYDITGVFKTVDKGQTWFELPTPGGNDTLFAHFQAWYDLVLEVNPTDENDVVGGGWHLWRSRDGGTNWYQISHGRPDSAGYQYVHVDQHAILFQSADTVYFGNDGGIYKCTNFSDSLPDIYERNYGYRVTQFYSGAIPPDAGNVNVVGGSQDNGTSMIYQSGISPATYLTGWDGGFCAINHLNPSIIYTTKNSNGVYRVKSYGWAVPDTITNPYLTDADVQFINPIAIDKTDPEILYMGSNKGLWRLKNASAASDSDWVQASKLQAGISVLSVSEAQPHTVFIGKSSSAKIYRLENADTTGITQPWINCDPGNKLPSGGFGNPISCSGLYLDPDDVNHIFSVYSNYGIKNVWESKDVTASSPAWTAHDGDLPNIPVHSVFLHPENPEVCYIGTDLGVFFTSNLDGDNTNWLPCNTGLANVRITELLYRESDHTLTATSYGRGIFVATVPLSGSDYSLTWSERGPLDVGGRTRAIMIDPNDPTRNTIWAGAVSGGLWKTTNIDGLPVVGIQPARNTNFDVNVFPNPVTGSHATIEINLGHPSTVSVTAFNGDGKRIRDLWQNRSAASGTHRIVWNVQSGMNTGICYIVVEAGDHRLVKKVLVMEP
jgi:photosystem II stability/assembly factor-like uncharacterized protein